MTKDEFTSEFAKIRGEMKELSSDVKRHALMLFERTQEQLEMLATHVADISHRLPPRG